MQSVRAVLKHFIKSWGKHCWYSRFLENLKTYKGIQWFIKFLGTSSLQRTLQQGFFFLCCVKVSVRKFCQSTYCKTTVNFFSSKEMECFWGDGIFLFLNNALMRLNMEAIQEMHGYWNRDQQKKFQNFLEPLQTVEAINHPARLWDLQKRISEFFWIKFREETQLNMLKCMLKLFFTSWS